MRRTGLLRCVRRQLTLLYLADDFPVTKFCDVSGLSAENNLILLWASRKSQEKEEFRIKIS